MVTYNCKKTRHTQVPLQTFRISHKGFIFSSFHLSIHPHVGNFTLQESNFVKQTLRDLEITLLINLATAANHDSFLGLFSPHFCRLQDLRLIANLRATNPNTESRVAAQGP